MATLLKREDLEASTQETIAHLMFNSLVQINQMRSSTNLNVSRGDASGSSSSAHLIYSKYWDLATGYLKLSVMNELVQTFRTVPKLLEPILRTMFVLGKHLDSTSVAQQDQDLGRDLTTTLLKIVDNAIAAGSHDS